jgi:cobalt-zinc-cadmium resistance protein CzcA
MLTGVKGDLAIKLYGADLATLNRLAGEIESVLKTIPGAQDTLTVRNEGLQYLQVRIDRLAAGRYGFNVEEVQNTLRSLLEGRQLGQVIEGGRRTPLILRGSAQLALDPEAFGRVLLTTPEGQSLPLSALARIERVDGPVQVVRENAQRFAVIQSNVQGRDLVGFVEEAKAAVAARVPLPAGYRLAWGGQFENQQRAAARLGVVVPVALGLIFVLLFSTFGSVRQALLVLAMVPFALVGGVFALGLAGEYLSVPASVGFIALLGIAVLNGVVMLSHFNQLHARGMPLDQLIRDGARRRLRPVLMTASIAAFGLLPLMFATGPGAEVQRPLALVVVGGLLTATPLTLLLLPLLYRRFGLDAPKLTSAQEPAHD